MNVAVLLSGGVDSSVALGKVLRDPGQDGGHRVRAYYLKIWLEDEVAFLGECPWEEDLAHARAVCAQAGVPLEVVPLQREYYDRVVSYALDELRAGRTPSPDIFCNRRIKFGAFLDVLGDSCDKVATGHYGVVRQVGDHYALYRSPDPVKDQTYFLSHLTQDQLAMALFPIGDLFKRDVRALATEWDLPNRDRPDSQGICFLGKIRYPDFVRHYLGEKEGTIVEHETGRPLGTHRGYWFYTIGQRTGLGLSGGPWYVTAKDVADNVIRVSHKEHQQSRDSFLVSELNWIGRVPTERHLLLKIRHGPHLASCTLDGEREGTCRVTMNPPDAGIASGQFGVFYRGEECLGGGVITTLDPDD